MWFMFLLPNLCTKYVILREKEVAACFLSFCFRSKKLKTWLMIDLVVIRCLSISSIKMAVGKTGYLHRISRFEKRIKTKKNAWILCQMLRGRNSNSSLGFLYHNGVCSPFCMRSLREMRVSWRFGKYFTLALCRVIQPAVFWGFCISPLEVKTAGA